MLSIAFFSLILAFSSGQNPDELDHDFHLSKCDIDYNHEESAIQISLSIFIDDLELALRQEGIDSLYICTPKEVLEAEQYIFQYITEHLIIKVDGNLKSLEWIGKEVSEDLAAMWCYVQVSDVMPKKTISVSYDVLMKQFDDQQNVVKLQYDKSKKSFFLFSRDEFSGELKI